MKIELLDDVAVYGTNRKSGEILDVSEETGHRLCAKGLAMEVTKPNVVLEMHDNISSNKTRF